MWGKDGGDMRVSGVNLVFQGHLLVTQGPQDP